jgi:precorrin-6A/cobalt-precorrin-6A reductase
MILLLGGTSETAEVATRLAELGYKVLVSSATDAEQATGNHPNISHRTGRLNRDEMIALIRNLSITSIVDVAHPYAVEAHEVSQQAADEAGIPRLAYVRPRTASDANILTAANHEEAALLAFAQNRPVLLTTGSRNLEPYVLESRRTGTPLVARVLDYPPSIQECRDAGLDDEQIVVGRGPFSTEENRETIRQFSIGTLVTKDSGAAGGVEAKMEAARLEGCRVVLVQRPDAQGKACVTIDDLVMQVENTVPLDLG